MSRFKLAALTAVLLSAAACQNTTTSPTTPISLNPVTDTFTGTLARNGASTFPFSVSAAGLVAATLTSVSDPSVVVGMSIGTWTAATSTCTTQIANDQAVQGTVINGSATGIGNLCVRVYDVGKVGDPVDYQVSVTHY